MLKCRDEYYTELNGMPTGVLLFVWLPGERARWVEMRAKRGRALDSPCRVCQIGIGSRDGRSTLASGHRSAGEGEPSPGAGDPRVTPLRSA